jgi:DNA/RNA-binding domain of Phe-tRNA-synthetase-like protein
MDARLIIDPSLVPCPTLAACIWASVLSPPAPTTAAPPFLAEILEQAKAAGEGFWPAGLKDRVRKMLRHGRYKPSGRSKPASEFLLQAAMAGEFPLINPPVDVNNAVSLQSGYPGSLLDAGKSGTELMLRRGLPGESYVFNPSGQSIDLQDLLLVCRRSGEGWEPCGNPVKDAMITKTSESTREVIAVLFAPADEDPARLESHATRFARLLKEHCGAQVAGHRLVR